MASDSNEATGHRCGLLDDENPFSSRRPPEPVDR
jgi:hypothetical protein